MARHIIYLILIPYLLLENHAFSCDDLPKEVSNFVWGRDRCEHFLSEDYEPRKNEDMIWIDRREHVSDSIVLFCSGTERKLLVLKKRFKDNRRVMDLLSKYEDCEKETCD